MDEKKNGDNHGELPYCFGKLNAGLSRGRKRVQGKPRKLFSMHLQNQMPSRSHG